MLDQTEKFRKKRLAKRDDSVLVIVDVQEKLIPKIYNSEKVVENITRFAKAADIMDVPVVVTEQSNLGNTVKELGDIPDSIEKICFDCFRNEEFAERIAGLNRKTIFLAGIETHICICQTALSGLDDYDVQVIKDAASSRSPLDDETGIARCRQEGVVITSTETAIYELIGKAGTEKFRKILPLVK